MSSNAKQLVRFFSEQTYDNRRYLNDNVKITPTPLELPHSTTARKNFLTQISILAEEKIDQSEQEANQISEVLKQPVFTRVFSLQEDEEDISKSNVLIETIISDENRTISGLPTHRPIKPGTQRLRWNILFNILVWLVVPLPFWIPFVSNQVAIYLLPTIQGVFVLMWIIISVLALKNAFILYINRFRNFTDDCKALEEKQIRHIVAISCYKEPKELIAKSVQTIADQTEVHRITMVIGFEEGTPNKDETCRWLQEKFQNSGFARMIFTIHPKNIPNEIPGKCSNSNYSLRMAISQMNIPDIDSDYVLITTCDADSRFPPQYIAALTQKYLSEKCPALSTIYQAPLFYNWKLDGLSCVTRVTGLLRSLLMLGALIPFNINTMSIFSYSLSLIKKGNFVHPAYQMDDIICLIRWMGVTGQQLRISMIPVPVLSGPTSGETIETELIEWARQARRWTIGAAEVFHYYIIKSKRMPTRAATSWGIVFIIYYGVLLCTGGLYGLTSMLSMFLLVKHVPLAVGYVMYILFGLQMLAFSAAFLIDIIIPRLMHIEECIFFLRNLFHFVVTPIVLLAYSFVEFYALHEVVVFGRKVCKHGASKKQIL